MGLPFFVFESVAGSCGWRCGERAAVKVGNRRCGLAKAWDGKASGPNGGPELQVADVGY